MLSIADQVLLPERALFTDTDGGTVVHEGESSLQLLRRDQHSSRGLRDSNTSDNDADQSGNEVEYGITLLKSFDRLPGTRHLSAWSRGILKE